MWIALSRDVNEKISDSFAINDWCLNKLYIEMTEGKIASVITKSINNFFLKIVLIIQLMDQE